MILIISHTDDLHALAIQHSLKNDYGVSCSVFTTDTLSDQTTISNSIGGPTTICMNEVELGLDWNNTIIWNRREKFNQKENRSSNLENDLDHFVKESWRPVFASCLDSVPDKDWISIPYYSRRANSKIHELEVAKLCGLKTPKTLVSNSFDNIRSFSQQLGNELIIKPIYHHRSKFLETKRLHFTNDVDKESITVCPHLRWAS